MSSSISEFCKNPSVGNGWPLSKQIYYKSLCGVKEGIDEAFSQFSFTDLAEEGITQICKLLLSLLSFNSAAWTGLLEMQAVEKLLTLDILRNINSVAKDFFAISEKGYLEVFAEKGTYKVLVNFSFWIASIFSAIGRIPFLGRGLTKIFELIRGISKFAGETVIWISEEGVEMTIADVAGALTKYLSSVLMTIQMLSMIIDMWDPCGFNNQINQDVINLYMNAYDKFFRTSLLMNVATNLSKDGVLYQLESWPINWPYQGFNVSTAYQIFINDKFFNDPELAGKAQSKFGLYTLEYNTSLSYNSNGYPLCQLSNDNVQRIPLDFFDKMDNAIVSFFTNENVIFRNWLERWSPLLYFILLIITVIIIFYKL